MRRDIDLIREILLFVEKKGMPISSKKIAEHISGKEMTEHITDLQGIIVCHVELMGDPNAFLICNPNMFMFNSSEGQLPIVGECEFPIVQSFTKRGYTFLKNSRDSQHWQTMRNVYCGEPLETLEFFIERNPFIFTNNFIVCLVLRMWYSLKRFIDRKIWRIY